MIKDILEDTSGMMELNEISDFLKDDEFDECLTKIIKIIAKPDIPPSAASILIVQMSAWSVKFRMLAKHAMLYADKGEDSSKKKNTYLTLADSLDNLINSLKYVTRI